MLFAEKKINNEFYYNCQDIFGELEIWSEEKLDKNTIDEITVEALGKVPIGSQDKIRWKLTKKDSWGEDEEENL